MNGNESQAVEVAAQRASDALDVVIELLEEIQKIIARGRPQALKVKFGDRTVVELPLALTAGAAFVAGLAAVVVTKLTVEVEHED